jgi:hypothetical protein
MQANACPIAMRMAWHAAGTYDKGDGSGGCNGKYHSVTAAFSCCKQLLFLHAGQTADVGPHFWSGLMLQFECRCNYEVEASSG